MRPQKKHIKHNSLNINAMNKKTGLLSVLAACLLLATSCKKDDDSNDTKASLSIPSSYVSADYAANVTTETALKTQLSGLSTYMKTAESGTTALDLATLKDKFNTGTTSLKSVTGTYYITRIENDWFPAMVAASGNAYDPANGATATKGGSFGNRLVDKGAKENLQEIEKGLYAAALYNHLVAVSEGTLTQAAVDKMISIVGASPAFPNTNTAANTNSPDALLALYMARRDKNDGAGFYGQMKANFLKLQAAVKAGADYNTEKNEAVAAIKLNIEKGLMATAVNYGYAAITKFSTTNPPVTTLSGGLHDLGEAIGFIHGFKAVAQQHRKITDAQIDEILALLNAPANADATVYKFITEGASELQRITQALAKIKAVYGFTDAEMNDFKQNWISVQGR